MTVTVTGSTGTIGMELVKLLSPDELPVRAVFRRWRELPKLPYVAWVQADLSDVRLLEPVLAGSERLFILTDNSPGAGAIQIAIIRAAASLGVKFAVKLSALGASDHSKAPFAREHWEAEQALMESGMSWTILRPHAFMQNWLGDVARSVRRGGPVVAAVGGGRVPFVDTRDIAAVAAEILRNPEAHTGKRYVLTGGAAVSYSDLAEVLSAELGRKVDYRVQSPDEARATMEKRGIPKELIDGMLALASYQRSGGPTERTSQDIELVLGRKPRTVREFVHDHRDAFFERS